MQTLQKGKFFGVSTKPFFINGLTIVDSSFHQYTHCPWHYHQNAHFAFTTSGSLTETHKCKKIFLSAGSLMYNHSQEPHCNSDYSEHVAALHVDISGHWFKKYDINFSAIEGVRELNNPVFKNIFFNLFRELKHYDIASSLAVESMILQLVSYMMKPIQKKAMMIPAWVARVKSLLYEKYNEELLLNEIACELNLHPVYLCQQFSVYFNCSFGEYIRKIRIEKAVTFMLTKRYHSLTEIGYTCGFADQSHFIRTFKKNIGITPLAFKRFITE